ncbi:MAG: DinB family protein [Melioribacteraceae bacterium]
MVKSINDFLTTWKYESEATLKVFKNLTDASLNQKVAEDGRSLGFIAWHITMTIPEMLSKTGLPFQFKENTDAPASAQTILSEYERLSGTVTELISKEWKDEMLKDDLNMYGQVWKRADVLFSLIVHQTHHRGQMTVLMRQAGLKVPGVYGPSREEWTAFGMPEQK